jgi:hypothetical protein
VAFQWGFARALAGSQISGSRCCSALGVGPVSVLGIGAANMRRKGEEVQTVKRVVALAAMVLLVGVSALACGGGGWVSDITEQALIEGVVASVDEQESCRFETRVEGSLEGTMEGEYGGMDLAMELHGTVDMSRRELEETFSISGEISSQEGQVEMGVTELIYVIDDMMYIGFPELGQPDAWIKGDMSQEIWESQDLLGRQIELLRGADVRLMRTESIRGVPCYVVDLSPDLDLLGDVAESMLGGGAATGMSIDSISDYEYTGWYAKDTYFPMRVSAEYDIALKAESDSLTGHYSTDMEIWDYNKAVSIQLPSEAGDAQYVGSLDPYLPSSPSV